MSLPRDRERDLERLLDDDGGELGTLYRRLPRAEPPRRLDRSVLGEAARAVQGRTPRRHRWVVGLGSAAGIVLAAGIAWNVGQNALQQPTGAQHAAPTVVPVEPITESSLRKRERDDTAQSAAAAPAPASAPAQPAKPAVARKAAPKPDAPPPPAAMAPEPPPAPAIVPAPLATPFPTEAENRAESAAPAQTGGALIPSDKAIESKQSSASDALDQAMTSHARSSAPPAPSGSVELQRDMQLSPRNWLAHIEQLLHQGRRQQATESLRMFRRVHPGLPVSSELRALEN